MTFNSSFMKHKKNLLDSLKYLLTEINLWKYELVKKMGKTEMSVLIIIVKIDLILN